MNSKACHIKKGDTVKVLSGKEKGRTGKVLEVNLDSLRATVDGLMKVKRHLKKGRIPSAPEGGIVDRLGTIHVSNLMIVDPKTQQPSRIGRRRLEDGRNVRYAKRSGEVLA